MGGSIDPVSYTHLLGYTAVPMNVGSMTNSGVEIDLNYQIMANKKFNWSVNLNATFVKNNTTAINTEKDRAIAKETSLEAKIDTNLQNHKDDMAAPINKKPKYDISVKTCGAGEYNNGIIKR